MLRFVRSEVSLLVTNLPISFSKSAGLSGPTSCGFDECDNVIRSTSGDYWGPIWNLFQ